MKSPDSTAFLYRQYMLENSFELYYYKDYPKKGVDTHIHNFYEFYFFLEGNLEMTMDGQVCLIHPGNIVIIPPGMPHCPSYIDPSAPYRRFVLWVHKDYYRKYFSKDDALNLIFKHCAEAKRPVYRLNSLIFNDLQNKLFQIIRENQENRFGRDTQILLLLQSIMLTLGRCVSESGSRVVPASQSFKSKICTYIDEHIREEITLDMLADAFFLNKYYISHTFTETMGISIHQYIIKRRLEACKNALLSEEPMEKIASDYGFNSYSSFFRFFKKEYGVSPKEFRQTLPK